jgi:hypothetical protein
MDGRESVGLSNNWTWRENGGEGAGNDVLIDINISVSGFGSGILCGGWTLWGLGRQQGFTLPNELVFANRKIQQ